MNLKTSGKNKLFNIKVIEAFYFFMNTDVFFYELFNVYSQTNNDIKEKDNELNNIGDSNQRQYKKLVKQQNSKIIQKKKL